MSYKLHWESHNNINGKIYVVGDIHGYYDELRRLLKSVNFDYANDKLYALGDLIDRGPLSHEVLEWLGKPWFISILGNHEVIAMEYYKTNGKEWTNWEIFGGKWFMDLPRDEQEKYVNAFKKLPHVIELNINNEIIGLVHGECPVDDWWEFKFTYDNHEYNALWGYTRFYKATLDANSHIKNVKYVINGHNNVKNVSISKNTIYMDTGKMSGHLSLLEINNPSGELKLYV